MTGDTIKLSPALVAKLEAATPAPGDFVLYCPRCEAVGVTNGAQRPRSLHETPRCPGAIRIWKHPAPRARVLADEEIDRLLDDARATIKAVEESLASSFSIPHHLAGVKIR